MTQDIFEQQVTLSQKRLETLWQQASTLPKKSVELWRQAPEFQQEQQALLKESLEELSNALEELQVVTEELRQTNEELTASRIALKSECQRYQELFEFAPYGLLVTTKQGAICEANPMAAQLLNVSQEWLIGKPLVLFVTAQKRPDFYSQLSQLQKGEPINSWQLEIQPRNRIALKAFCTADSIKDAQNQVVGLRWCIQDLTFLLEQTDGGMSGRRDAGTGGREDTEMQRRADAPERNVLPMNATGYEQLAPALNQILSSSTEFFFVLDQTGKSLYINPTAANILGFSQTDLIGKNWRQFEFPAAIRERIEAQWETVFNTKQSLTEEVRFPTVNGVRDYQYTITPIRLIKGWEQDNGEREMANFSNLSFKQNPATGKPENLETVVIIAKDITEQKQAAANKVALTKAAELSALKSHFVSFISHELRDPLNTIACGAQLMETYSQQWSKEKRRDYLQQIQVNVKQINQLLDDLLLIGKIEAGQPKLKPALIDIAEFCRHLIQQLELGAGRKHQLTLINEGSRSGIWDEQVLRRILMNLLLNAIKYSPEGSEVKLSVICQDRQVRFSIEDSGMGILPEERELIFQPFQRGSNVGTIPGHGLGLAIAKQCVELQSGEIFVDSKVGVGTTVTLTLPLNLRAKLGV